MTLVVKMNGREIYRILSRDSITAPFFIGVFPSDKIPIIKRKAIMIVNVDKESLPGSHWLALYIKNSKELEFFDSYGRSPSNLGKNIEDYTANFPTLHWNPICFQSLSSNVCGHYCIYFLFKRIQGKSMDFILHDLNKSKNNDFKMYLFVRKRYNVKMVLKK